MRADEAAGLRVLIYSHDTFGLGHLRRSRAIAHAVVAAHPGARVTIVSGSPVVDRYAFAAGVRTVRLPPVTKLPDGAYASGDPSVPLAETVTRRAAAVGARRAGTRGRTGTGGRPGFGYRRPGRATQPRCGQRRGRGGRSGRSDPVGLAVLLGRLGPERIRLLRSGAVVLPAGRGVPASLEPCAGRRWAAGLDGSDATR